MEILCFTISFILLPDIKYGNLLMAPAVTIKVGDKVIYSKYAGTDVKLGDEEFIVVKQNDIVAIVED